MALPPLHPAATATPCGSSPGLPSTSGVFYCRHFLLKIIACLRIQNPKPREVRGRWFVVPRQAERDLIHCPAPVNGSIHTTCRSLTSGLNRNRIGYPGGLADATGQQGTGAKAHSNKDLSGTHRDLPRSSLKLCRQSVGPDCADIYRSGSRLQHAATAAGFHNAGFWSPNVTTPGSGYMTLQLTGRDHPGATPRRGIVGPRLPAGYSSMDAWPAFQARVIGSMICQASSASSPRMARVESPCRASSSRRL
ncbi:hypothetical protein SAMN03097708_01656 [Thiohalomonas denitrificans]|uniref:Uncharacterized protein n=1 Tax=Thiohalomonas denitrificans TaxID=415747 RepID=A0A1G5Q8T5_9GAMM|nr:hypothetical protein SAMN03097708_01656 [Thiohalomonas denitrificans]